MYLVGTLFFLFILLRIFVNLKIISPLNVCVYKLNLYCCLEPNTFSLSPWGENSGEPTPKLETGWANFDSSFEEPVVTNGGMEQVIKPHELFPDIVEQNAQDGTLFESHDDTISSIKNLTCKNYIVLCILILHITVNIFVTNVFVL